MAAFDVTTKPTSLSLKPGSTGSIMVVVSNRLGRPVMGLVEGTLTPASAAKWLVSPPDLQRRYEADPAATVNYEFKVAVPKDAPAQSAQFKASVRDVLAPDDTRVEGQTVAINVTPDAVAPKPPRTGIPWWVFVIAGVVVLGVGLGIYLLVRQKGVPDVVGKPPAEAIAILTKAGFDSVIAVDTLGDQAKDTNRVVRQEPEPKANMPKAAKDSALKATIVVNRSSATVPALVGEPLAFAIDRINQAGLRTGTLGGKYTGVVSEGDRIVSTNPVAGTVVALGSPVSLVIYKYSETPPKACTTKSDCYVVLDPKFKQAIQQAQPNVRTMTR
jgi:hypothetical protein